jgi:anti-anti-sigma factor
VRRRAHATLRTDLAHRDWLTGGGKGPPLRNVEARLDPAEARVTLVGEIDMADAGPLRELLEGVVSRFREVEVDLRGVRFIDSAGCHALIQVAQHAAEMGGRLRVVTGEGAVKKVFSLLAIGEILGVEEEEDRPPA